MTSPDIVDVQVKVCPHCAVQAATAGTFCPHCGMPYTKDRSRRRGRVVAASVVAVLVLVGAVVGFAFHASNTQAAERARASEAAAADKAATDKAATDKAATDKAATERAARAATVKQIESSITKDAEKSVEDDIITGPIINVTCTPTAGGSTEDLDTPSTTYQCFVANKDNGDGTLGGYYWDATSNWADGTATWGMARS
jgi:hypothetical protein